MLAANEVLAAIVLAANEVGDIGGGDRLSNGSKRIEPKTRRSENQKSAKSQKLSKSEKFKGKKSKKPSTSGNLPNFNVKDRRPSFLTPKARSTFNYLWLALTKALILWHLDPKCHIWIKTDASDYFIDGMLSQLASRTSLNGVFTKTNLSQ